MEELERQLEEKITEAIKVGNEIIELRRRIKEEQWKGKQECTHDFSEVSEGNCPYAETRRGMIFCKNINCHK